MTCMERLLELYEGKITVIEELEEKQLDILGNGETFGHEHVFLNSWGKTVSVNVITW